MEEEKSKEKEIIIEIKRPEIFVMAFVFPIVSILLFLYFSQPVFFDFGFLLSIATWIVIFALISFASYICYKENKTNLLYAFILLEVLIVGLGSEIKVTYSNPIAFGDEGFHVRISQYMAEHKEYPKWSPIEGTKLTKFNFSRPPYWNLLLSGFFTIFEFSEFLVKFLTPFIAVILTGLGTYLLVKNIYNKEVGLIAAIILVTIPSIVTYAVLFYTDTLLVLYFSLFFFTLILAFKTDGTKYWLLAGIFGALVYLTKTPGIAIVPMIGLTFLYKVYREKSIIVPIKKYLILGVPLMMITGGFFVRNLVMYNALSCEIPMLSGGDSCGYTFEYKNVQKFEGQSDPSGTGLTVDKFGVMNYITFAYGNPLFVFFAFLAGLAVIVMMRNSSSALIILMMLSFLPILYFGGRGRSEDTARFALGLAPVIALIAANYFERVYDFIKGYFKLIAIAVIVFVVAFGYLGLKEKLDGMVQVKQFSPLFFDACKFVKQNVTQDALIATIWDHQTAYNCQRNAVGFAALPDQADIELGSNVTDVVSKLKAHGITHIFIQKFSLSEKNLQDRFPISFVRFLNNNPNNFKKIYENGVDAETCISQGGCDGSIVYQIL